jgi:hypothetical protein
MSDPSEITPTEPPPGDYVFPAPPLEEEGDSQKWRPDVGDLITILGCGVGIIVWLRQPSWEIGLALSLFAIAMVGFAAVRHSSHPFWRGSISIIAIVFFVAAVWRPIWDDFHEKHPTTTWSALAPQDRTNHAAPSSAPLPPVPIQSRMDRFIFECAVPVPQTLEEDAKQKELLQKNIRGWADTFGLSASFSEIRDGTQITIEAKTNEAKVRFVSMGIAPGITKIILEARRIDGRQIVVARAEVPKNYQYLSMLTPDPSVQQIIDGQRQIARFLGGAEDACRLL